MASVVGRTSKRFLRSAELWRHGAPSPVSLLMPRRPAVTTSTGAVLPKPGIVSFGILRVSIAVLPFLYLGTLMSQRFAAFLEDYDIFLPSYDDD
uniref:Essential MCU regulator, mitochondrial n=1 Tax=Erpetoichthys calabaricus TaxID=27687 RepID=A0A8C4S726_ERPCA